MNDEFQRFAEQARLGGGIVPVTREVVLDEAGKLIDE